MYDIDIAIPSVCPTCSTIVSKWLNISAYFLQHHGSSVILIFAVLNIFAKFRHVGYINFTIFDQ